MTGRLVIITALLAAAVVAGSCGGAPQNQAGWERQRRDLVALLKRDGITDRQVLDAIGQVPRHEFVPKGWRDMSYLNRPLSIGQGQTISQPYIVAYMCQELRLTPEDKVLEIGTGSGYHAAVMSLLAKSIYTIEIIPELGESARARLARLGYENIEVRIGDGYLGLPEESPFDAVILTAAPPEIPQPLLEQLKVGGRLIAPVGVHWQELVLVERTEEGYVRTKLIPVAFVPMTGEAQRAKPDKP